MADGEGQQIVPETWVSTSTSVHAFGENHKDYGYLFWVYPTHFAAEGLGEQMIQVIKNQNLVVVMTSAIDWHTGPVILKLLQDYIIPSAKTVSSLPPNPLALTNLRDKVSYLANPVQPVQPLPEIAQRISGKTYTIQDNPAGWKNIRVIFHQGQPEAQATVVSVDGATTQTGTVALGLDNVYRLERMSDGSFTARRASWADDHTLVVRQLQSWSDLEETEIRVEFNGNKLKIHVEEAVFGNYNYDFEGILP